MDVKLSIQLEDLKRRNHLYTMSLIVCGFIGFLFNVLQFLQNDLPNYLTPIALISTITLIFVCRYMNKQNRWLTITPYIGFASMMLLTYLILMNGKRLAAIMIIYVFLMIVTIYMQRIVTTIVYLIGIPLHFYYLDRMGFTYPEQTMDTLLYIVFFTIVFTILFNLERITHHLISDLNRLQENTNRLNIELEFKNEELMRLDQMKDQFISNTSHELRTPINGIVGLAEAIYDGSMGKISPAVAENMKLILMSGMRLGNIVNDILDLSTIRSHQLELNLKPINPSELILATIDLYMPSAIQKKIQLHNHFSGQGPMDGEWPKVLADAYRLSQILRHIYSNAVKFTLEGHVTVTGSVQGKWLTITIQDTGIGIPESKISSVFNMFEQADGDMNRSFGGTGLGLTLVKALIELQNGQLEVASEEGKWTRVTLRLPVADVA